MATADRLYWLHALTPLHIGAGRGEGYIDLPLVREKLTSFPFVPGSSVKGVFADSWNATEAARNPVNQNAAAGENVYDEVLHAAFGRADQNDAVNAGANAGAIVFTDARLVCLPVRSLFGTFAWCTSPMVLQRLTRDWKSAGFRSAPIPDAGDSGCQILIPDSSVAPSILNNGGSTIYLEDLDMDVVKSAEATEWADRISEQLFPDPEDDWRTLFRQRFAILTDEAFGYLAETGTELQAHIRIDPDFKRVVDGALWYEECLPAEAILCGLVWCDPPRAMKALKPKIEALLQTRSLQMGGKATTGKGRVKMVFSPLASNLASGGAP
jgi:CRISPR-associated protein Cmr4